MGLAPAQANFLRALSLPMYDFSRLVMAAPPTPLTSPAGGLFYW